MASAAPVPVIDRIASAELPLVLLLAPALLFPTAPRLALALLLLPVWLCARRATGHALPPTPLNWSLYLLLAMVAVSAAVTFDVNVSLGKVSGVLLGVALFWAATRWMATRNRFVVGLLAFESMAGALALVGLVGTNWIDKFPPIAAVTALLPRIIRGVPGAEEGFHPNPVAGCLVLFIPLQLALLVRHPTCWVDCGRWRPPGWLLVGARGLLLVMTTGVLVLTQSRGALLGAGMAATVFFLVFNETTRRAAVAAVTLGVAALFLSGPRSVFDFLLATSELERDVPGRLEVWSRAVAIIQDAPLTGVGMNTFRTILPALYPPSLTAHDFDVAHAHNHLLQAAVDVGIPGLIAYLSLWFTAAAVLVRVYRWAVAPVDRLVAGALGLGLIAHFTFSLTDAIPLGAKVGIVFWVTLALVVALQGVALPDGRDRFSGDREDREVHERPAARAARKSSRPPPEATS
jgi:putative inorganic carbon (HCO3(-)) transporter